MSVGVVAWAQDKGTHDAEVRPCRAQDLSQSSSPCHGTLQGKGLLKSHGLSETPIVGETLLIRLHRED